MDLLMLLSVASLVVVPVVAPHRHGALLQRRRRSDEPLSDLVSTSADNEKSGIIFLQSVATAQQSYLKPSFDGAILTAVLVRYDIYSGGSGS
eukprot:1000-Heterococcus_DN1.PRE.1